MSWSNGDMNMSSTMVNCFFPRNLSQEYISYAKTEASDLILDSHLLVSKIATFFLDHNAEIDACDFLYELGLLNSLVELAQSHNYERICLYLVSCASFETFPDDKHILKVAFDIYHANKCFVNALLMAIRLGSQDLQLKLLNECSER